MGLNNLDFLLHHLFICICNCRIGLTRQYAPETNERSRTRCIKLKSSSGDTQGGSFQCKQCAHKGGTLLGSWCFFLLVSNRKKSLRFYNHGSGLMLLSRLKWVPPRGPGAHEPRHNLKSASQLVIILGHPVKANTRGLQLCAFIQGNLRRPQMKSH